MATSVIIAGSRTPMGRLSGELAAFTAVELGGFAIRAAVERSGISPGDVDYVVMGQVLQAGCGQLPARQAAVAGSIPMSTPAVTVNKVCLSGLDAVTMADQSIRAGDHTTVVAGGMESMTNAPHVLPRARSGIRFGAATLADSTEHDGLTDAFTDGSMGALTEAVNTASSAPLTRGEMDEYAARSHQRAAAAQAAGILADEITPVSRTSRAGTVVIDRDENIRPDTTVETLARLRPAFAPDGAITAASSSPVSDGAVAMVVMDKAEAVRRGLRWIAEIGPSASVSGPDSSLQLQPANAIRAVCARAGIEPRDLDLVEINEAFAAVGIASIRDLGIDPDIVNVNGGAIALGHPIGASGARLVLHAALELGRRGGGTGVVALCGGGGQGQAMILRVGETGN